jgi:hypothetical protein
MIIETIQAVHHQAPVSQIDLYSDDTLLEPWDKYRPLQSLGSAAWRRRHSNASSSLWWLKRGSKSRGQPKCARAFVASARRSFPQVKITRSVLEE